MDISDAITVVFLTLALSVGLLSVMIALAIAVDVLQSSGLIPRRGKRLND